MNLDEGSDGRTEVFICSADRLSIEGSLIKLRKLVKKKWSFAGIMLWWNVLIREFWLKNHASIATNDFVDLTGLINEFLSLNLLCIIVPAPEIKEICSFQIKIYKDYDFFDRWANTICCGMAY